MPTYPKLPDTEKIRVECPHCHRVSLEMYREIKKLNGYKCRNKQCGQTIGWDDDLLQKSISKALEEHEQNKKRFEFMRN